MAFTRTRIWRGDQLGLPPGDAPSGSAEPAVSEPDARAAAPGAELYEVPLAAPPPGKRVLAATRFLPIEQLFPGQHAAPQARRTAPADLEAEAWALRLKGGLLTRILPVRPIYRRGLALALVLALGGAKLIARVAREGGARAAQQTPAQTLVPAESESGPASDEARLVGPNPSAGARRPASAPAPLPQGLERKAVDALVAGDLARAEKLYAQLVHAGAPQAAIHEALRILSARSASRHP